MRLGHRRQRALALPALGAAILLVVACDGDEPGRATADGTARAGESSAGSPDREGGGRGGNSGGGEDGSVDAGAGTRDDEAGAGAPMAASRGRVVDLYTKRPLSERRVIIADTSTWSDAYHSTSDADGYFDLPALSGDYRALIVEPDDSAISAYDRLSSKAPVLLHRSSGIPQAFSGHAQVSGRLSGGSAYPLSNAGDIVVMHLFSPRVVTAIFLGGGETPAGPDYAMGVNFPPKEGAMATLLAVGTFATTGDEYTAAVGTTQIKLADRDEQSADVELAQCAVGSIGGVVTVPSSYQLADFSAYYRMPMSEARIDFPLAHTMRKNPSTSAGEFAYELPNLDGVGAKLCVSARCQGTGELFAERCGLALDDTSVQMSFDAAPVLSVPAEGGPLAVGTSFEWSSAVSGVSLVELVPDALAGDAPIISLFTAKTQATLPDLALLDIDLVNAVDYRASVVSLGQYPSLDAATSPDSLPAIIPAETRTSRSASVSLVGMP